MFSALAFVATPNGLGGVDANPYDGNYVVFLNVTTSNDPQAIPVGQRANVGGNRFSISDGTVASGGSGQLAGNHLSGTIALPDGAGQLGGDGQCTVDLTFTTSGSASGSGTCGLSLFSGVSFSVEITGQRLPGSGSSGSGSGGSGSGSTGSGLSQYLQVSGGAFCCTEVIKSTSYDPVKQAIQIHWARVPGTMDPSYLWIASAAPAANGAITPATKLSMGFSVFRKGWCKSDNESASCGVKLIRPAFVQIAFRCYNSSDGGCAGSLKDGQALLSQAVRVRGP